MNNTNLKFYKDLYDNLYKNYGYNSEDNDIHYRFFMGGIIKPCLEKKLIEFDSLLDIGCSFGAGLGYFEKLGKEIYGIDVSEVAINGARKKGFNCEIGSVTNLPYPDNFVDIIISTDVIEHVKPEDQEFAFKEMFRVSKKYIAHNISSTPEGNKYPLGPLHLTNWNQNRWIDFIDELKLDWEIIYTLTEKNWNDVKHKVYYFKPPPPFNDIIKHAAYLVLKKY